MNRYIFSNLTIPRSKVFFDVWTQYADQWVQCTKDRLGQYHCGSCGEVFFEIDDRCHDCGARVEVRVRH